MAFLTAILVSNVPQGVAGTTGLKQAGYATCHIGKWHLNGKFNSPFQPQPGDHGFDYWFSTQNNAAPSHQDPDNFVRNGQAAGKLAGYAPGQGATGQIVGKGVLPSMPIS